MTLKEELEILRGEPIQVFSGDPMDIPCVETSDPDRLCKHPVVSVNMITYNHEPYIRQAIEGVMMQHTDFEFELVIGEDCSTDKTREICFEYQKKYPDKIRVLWCDHNLYQNPHPAGNNIQRNQAHCRGEFIAYCEGDDYWIDPLKLQKQVDVMRQHPNVGLCYTEGLMYFVRPDKVVSRWEQDMPEGLISSQKAFIWLLFGLNPLLKNEESIQTATAMIRTSVIKLAYQKYADLFAMGLTLGDLQIWASCASLADVFYIKDRCSMYRSGSGCMSQKLSASKVHRDGMIVTFYLMNKVLGLTGHDMPSFIVDKYAQNLAIVLANNGSANDTIWKKLKNIKSCAIFGDVLSRARCLPILLAARLGCLKGLMNIAEYSYKINFIFRRNIPSQLRAIYADIANVEFNHMYEVIRQSQKCRSRLLRFLRSVRNLVRI